MDILDYFEYIIKKYETLTDNSPIRIYNSKTEKSITFKIRTRYYLELLVLETMKLLGSTANKIAEDKNDENVVHFKITEIVLVHCMIINMI